MPKPIVAAVIKMILLKFDDFGVKNNKQNMEQII
jgi:hypothetical protein